MPIQVQNNIRHSLIFLFLLFNGISLAQTGKNIHFNAIVVDTHNDFLSKAAEDHLAFDSDLKGITQSDLKRMQEG
ncbi:MAG TPA: hypothetical protein VHT72_08325, partial [Puia sp.]|nr:hypothetical protein [Puia sp.]